MAPGLRPPWREGWGLAVALALVATGLVLVPGGGLPLALVGDPEGDAAAHLWSQWWVWQRVAHDHALPVWTERIFFPEGGGFWSLGLGEVLLSLPLRPLLGPVPIFDGLLGLQLLAGALAATGLARRLGIAPRPAALAGVVFAFHAWVLAFPLASGVGEALWLWPWPLAAWGALDTLTRPGWRGPALLAGSLATLATASPVAAMMAGLGVLGVGAGWLLTRPPDRRAGLRRAAAAAALLAVLVAPVLLAFRAAMGAEQQVFARSAGTWPELPATAVPLTNALALADLVTPGAAALRVHEAGLDRLMFSGYLGFVALGLAAVGAVRGGPAARRALGGAAGALVLAAGPRFFVDADHTLTLGPNPVYRALYRAVPLFHTTIHSIDRFVVPVMLGVALAAAAGLAWLVRGLGPRGRGLATAGAAALVLVELLAVSPAPWPLPRTPARAAPASRAIAAQPGAVIDLPWVDPDTGRAIGDLLLQQTFHDRPIPYRNYGRGGQLVSPTLWESALFQQAVRPLVPDPVRRDTGCQGLAELAEAGFGVVAVHRGRLGPERAPAVEAPLAACLGTPRVLEEVALYEIPAESAQDPALRNPRGWRSPPRHGTAPLHRGEAP